MAPALIAGWLAAALAGTVTLGSLYYVGRRSQYESLVGEAAPELILCANRKTVAVDNSGLTDIGSDARWTTIQHRTT